MGETYVLSEKEMPRPGLIRMALAGKISNAEAARSLGMSIRQFQRQKVRFRESGPAGLVHRSRGRPSSRAMDPKLRERIVGLIRMKYPDLNDCHLTEKLTEVEKIVVSRESVRRIRLKMKRSAKRKRRSPKHRSRRLREASEGRLVQVDGSRHDWLGGRGPEMTLVGAVDDATGKILAGIFCPQEDTHGYATILDQIFRRDGLPTTIYSDGTSILVRNDDHWTLQEQLQGYQDPPQLGWALKELGIGLIRARSPQAKGRIENRWGTLQDRLVAEMTQRDIHNLEQANAFLPEFLEDFNQRFGVAPRERMSAWRKPGCGWQLSLCCRYHRKVARDNTVSLPAGREGDPCRAIPLVETPPRVVQIPPGPGERSYAGCSVEVRELLDGRVTVHYRGHILVTDPAPKGAFRLTPRVTHRRSLPSAANSAEITQIRKPPSPKKTGPAGQKPDPKHPWSRWQPAFCRPSRPKEGDDILTLQLQ